MNDEVSISAITEADIADVAAFLDRQRRPGEAVPVTPPPPPERRLRWLLLENPARANDIPFGWCIRDHDGRVVGSFVCVPFAVGRKGFGCTALMGSKFYVEQRQRGRGGALFVRFVGEGQRFPLLTTTANQASGMFFSRFGGYLIDGMDHTMLGVARTAPLAEEWLCRRTGRPALARVLAWPAVLAPGRLRGRPASGSSLQPCTAADAGSFPFEPDPEVLAMVRDERFLRWRYFSPESQAQVLRYQRDGSPQRMVALNEMRSGHRAQIRVLNVLDIWPRLDGESAADLLSLLAQRYRGGFDAIWLRSQPAAAEEALRAAGCLSHQFPAPLGWCIDPSNLLPTRQWYLVPGESE